MALLACGCSEQAPTAAAPALAASSQSAAVTASTSGPVAAAAFQPFSVRVILSPEAAREMARRHETLIVSASYYGWPADGRELPVDDVGQVPLGRAQHELSKPSTTRFIGTAFKSADAGGLKGLPRVNINVYSGRHSSSDNLLDCDIFEDDIAIAARAVVPLHCTLLRALTAPVVSRTQSPAPR